MVGIIETIRCAQALGFTLKELADALPDVSAGQALKLDSLTEQIDRKRRALQAQIDTARARLEQLDELQQRLSEAPTLWDCEKSR